jgi:hypothetical protein
MSEYSPEMRPRTYREREQAPPRAPGPGARPRPPQQRAPVRSQRQEAGQTANPSATRYLSAGAYLDPSFRDEVIESVLDQEHTAVAPSYSIDIVPVLKHCLASARRQNMTELMVAGVVLLCVVASFRESLTLFCIVYGFICAGHVLVGFDRRDFVSMAMYGVLALVLGGIAAGTVQSIVQNTDYADVDTITDGLGRLVITLLVALAGAAAVLAWHEVSTHQLLLDEFTPEKFRPDAAPPAPSRHRERLAYLAQAQHGNVTIYGQRSRNNPFLGCGKVSEAWSLALPLVADPRQAGDPEPLDVDGLYRDMRKALISLADPRQPEDQRIKGLSLQQRIFVSGLLPPGHSLLDERRQPRLDISQDDVDRLSQDERSRSAQLLTVRINGWDGELDVTVLLYFSVRGNMLYTEFTACSLPPVRPDYHRIDTMESMGSSVYLRAIVSGVMGAPNALIACPMAVLAPAVETMNRSLDLRGQLQRITNQLAFDYGAVTSVRELGAGEHGNLFHRYDSERYAKIVNRRVIEAITEVLAAHGYSNDDFVQRTSVYIDNRMNIRGNNNSVALAHGRNAKASTGSGLQANPSGVKA